MKIMLEWIAEAFPLWAAIVCAIVGLGLYFFPDSQYEIAEEAEEIISEIIPEALATKHAAYVPEYTSKPRYSIGQDTARAMLI